MRSQERQFERIEKTISVTNTDKFCEAICAFSNDLGDSKKPGYLVIGIHDNGTPSGITVTEGLLQSLSSIRSEGNIIPMPLMTVQKMTVLGSEVVVVEVYPNPLPPVRYKSRTFIRIGPRRALATVEEERRLSEKRVSHARTFDALPCLTSSLKDIDQGLFLSYLPLAVSEEVLRANGRPFEMKLAALHFFDLVQQKPTNAGMTLFSPHLTAHLPGAYVQFLHIQGISSLLIR